jgi:hypothetical protein
MPELSAQRLKASIQSTRFRIVKTRVLTSTGTKHAVWASFSSRLGGNHAVQQRRPRLPHRIPLPMRPDRYQDSFANDAENDAGVPLRLERYLVFLNPVIKLLHFESE